MAGKNGDCVLKKIITLSDLAALTVQSERSVQRLVKGGILKLALDGHGRQLKGRFVLGESVPRAFEYLRDQIADADPNESAFRAARARKMEALATSEEMRVKLQTGALVERAHIVRVISNLLVVVRNHVLSIPSRCMHRLVGKTDPCEINLLLRDEVEGALREVSAFDVKKIVAPKAIAAQRGRNGERE